MNDSAGAGAEPTKASAYYVFTLLFLLYLFDYMDRMVVVSLFPSLKDAWGLTDTQCGLLVSAVYWSILIFTLPVSIIIDRWSRKKCIGTMALLWSAATLACAFTRNFTHLFIARTAIGIGEAGYAPGGTAMISALFPKEKRAKILGLWNASIPLGSAMGIVAGGYIAEHFGWRHAFGIVALPGMIIALMFFYVRDYETIALQQQANNDTQNQWIKIKPAEIALQFLKNKTLLFNNLAFAANTFVTTSLLTWLPTYYHRLENLPMDKAGTKGGAIMLLAIIGAPLGGFLTDRWLQKRKNARALFPAISSFCTCLLLVAAFIFLQGHGGQYAVLLMTGISAVAFVPAAVAVTQDVVHPGVRAISLSLCVIVQHVLGSALGPPSIGALSDAFGLQKALMFLPAFSILAAVLFFMASFFYVEDSQKAENIISKPR